MMTRRQFDRYLTIHIAARVLLILAAALLLALLYLSVTRLHADAAPRIPRSPQQQEQRIAPRATPTRECFNRMAGTCGREWGGDAPEWDRRTRVPTPVPTRRWIGQ